MDLGSNTNLGGAVKPSNLEQDAFEPLIHAHRYMEVPPNMQMRIEYSGDNPLFIGYAPRGLGTDGENWIIHKNTHDVSNRITLRQVAYDTWDNRATASYA